MANAVRRHLMVWWRDLIVRRLDLWAGMHGYAEANREWLESIDHAAALCFRSPYSRLIRRMELLFVEAPGKRGPARCLYIRRGIA
jgi:hypothetical protein